MNGYIISEDIYKDSLILSEDSYKISHYCPVKILDLEINRVDHHPLGR